MYCILGVQVNVQSSILGEGKRGPDRVPDPDGRRYQTAGVGAKRAKIPASSGPSKGKAECCCVPRTWLMPARMIINTESMVGYNNKLK